MALAERPAPQRRTGPARPGRQHRKPHIPIHIVMHNLNSDLTPGSGSASEQRDATRISVTFVVLTFLLSTPFWYLNANLPSGNSTMRLSFGTMWCPALAAVLTRLIYRRGLRGFGFTLGKPRWLVLAVLLPVFGGLVVYGAAWLFHIAPFNAAKLPKLFSWSGIALILAGLGYTSVAALGEELGWRGLLVPELSRRTSYTKLSLVTGLIWTVWHFPLIFIDQRATGPLSLVFFTVWVVASAFVHAWMRLVSGSVVVSALLHGSANYFFLMFYPTFTIRTTEGEAMLGEFGWAVPIVSGVVAFVFWCYRSRVPGNSGGAT